MYISFITNNCNYFYEQEYLAYPILYCGYKCYSHNCTVDFLVRTTSGTLRSSRKRWRNNATKDAAFVSSYECRCFSDVMSYWKNETKYSDQHVYIGIRNLSCSACIDYGNAYIWINADFHDCRTCNPVGYCYRFCFLRC